MSEHWASGTVPLPTDTIRVIEAKILLALGAGGGGGGGGNGQMVIYETTDPTTEGRFPTNLAGPAMAYRRDNLGAQYTWDPVAQGWF